MRSLIRVLAGMGLAVVLSNSASAALLGSFTINDITDDTNFPVTYGNSNLHVDNFAITVESGNFDVEFVLSITSGNFDTLSLELEGIEGPISALVSDATITHVLLSSVGSYNVIVSADRNGGAPDIVYNLAINTLSVAENPNPVPLPAAALLFGSGLAVLGYAGRKKARQS